MNNSPLVSIVTVVLNGENHLEQTLNSVINQSYSNIEYIIIDGGSTDGTIDLIKKYEKEIDYWISEPDKGLYDAMNKGIDKANGSLIGLINSDDWYELNAVKDAVATSLKYPDKNIFHADRYDIDENGDKKLYKFNSSALKNKYYDMTYDHTTMFIRSEEYEKHVYNTDLKIMSDYQFVLEAFLERKNTFKYIEKPLANYRLDGLSAQIGIIDALKEGFEARKIAGMSLPENILSLLIRCNIPLIRFIRTDILKKIKF